jgi:hypothetical protein
MRINIPKTQKIAKRPGPLNENPERTETIIIADCDSVKSAGAQTAGVQMSPAFQAFSWPASS